MRRLLRCLIIIIAAVWAQTGIAQSADPMSAEKTLDQELRTPTVSKKQAPYVIAYMKKIAENLYRQGFRIETMRNGEVVIAVIPSDEIFLPNEAEFLPGAQKALDSFRKFVAENNLFKVVIAIHSDDTGSEEYLFTLTENRILAIMDYYESHGLDAEGITGYPMGTSNPIENNDTRANRQKNRRIEIFIVPTELLINTAKNAK